MTVRDWRGGGPGISGTWPCPDSRMLEPEGLAQSDTAVGIGFPEVGGVLHRGERDSCGVWTGAESDCDQGVTGRRGSGWCFGIPSDQIADYTAY
jgi:hypothetical protein